MTADVIPLGSVIGQYQRIESARSAALRADDVDGRECVIAYDDASDTFLVIGLAS